LLIKTRLKKALKQEPQAPPKPIIKKWISILGLLLLQHQLATGFN
jgi:hypothetical protein